MLGMIAASTSRIRLGSGIVGVYPRTAVLTAMGFTTLASLAPGRVLAGLGASSPIIVEQWHGLGFDAPRARIEEYVADDAHDLPRRAHGHRRRARALARLPREVARPSSASRSCSRR